MIRGSWFVARGSWLVARDRSRILICVRAALCQAAEEVVAVVASDEWAEPAERSAARAREATEVQEAAEEAQAASGHDADEPAAEVAGVALDAAARSAMLVQQASTMQAPQDATRQA